MDQKKTGLFLKELRKEKKLTQEQLAEYFNVSDRTVSRWETGTNMPDLSLLIEIADFYNVDIREIIDGERRSGNMKEDMKNDMKEDTKEEIKTEMKEEMKETLVKVADYANAEKKTKKKKLNRYFIAGGLCIITVILNNQFDILSYVFVDNAAEFVSGALCALGILFECIGFYNNNHDVSLKQRKISLIKSKRG